MYTRLFLFPLLFAARLPAAEAIDPKRAANTVILTETGVKNLGIELVEVEETEFDESVFALGRINIMSGKRAVVSTRIAGRAQTVLVKPDMQCEAGDELLWVESRQPGDPPPVIRVNAPIAGLIAKVNVAPGQPVGPDDSLMEIYDLSIVEAKAAVPQHLAGRIGKGMETVIRVPGFPGREWKAEMAHTGADADVSSGTVEAAFHVPNEDGVLRPGMLAEFSLVLAKREGVMSVPRAAIQGSAADRYVFVEDSDPTMKNSYVKSPVVVGQMTDQKAEIVSGVFPADKVVVRGAYSLAFAGGGSVSLKEALDAAHGHEHNADGSELTPEQKKKEEAAKGGHAHGDEEGGGDSLLWKVISGVLAAALVLTALKSRKSSDDDKPKVRPQPKPQAS